MGMRVGAPSRACSPLRHERKKPSPGPANRYPAGNSAPPESRPLRLSRSLSLSLGSSLSRSPRSFPPKPCCGQIMFSLLRLTPDAPFSPSPDPTRKCLRRGPSSRPMRCGITSCAPSGAPRWWWCPGRRAAGRLLRREEKGKEKPSSSGGGGGGGGGGSAAVCSLFCRWQKPRVSGRSPPAVAVGDVAVGDVAVGGVGAEGGDGGGATV